MKQLLGIYAVTVALCIAVGFVIPSGAAPPKRINVILTESLNRLQAAEALDLKGTGVDEVIVDLPTHGANLYAAGSAQSDLRDDVAAGKSAAQGLPFGLAFWGYSLSRSYSADPAVVASCQIPALPEKDWQVFIERWRWLNAEAKAAGVQHLVMDCEIYPFTAGGNGGDMNGKAWRLDANTVTRAKAYGAAAQVPLGEWCLFHDGLAHPGFRPWWRNAWTASASAGKPEALLEEYFFGTHSAMPDQARGVGARAVPFLMENWSAFNYPKIADECRHVCADAGTNTVALYDAPGHFLGPKPLLMLKRAVRLLHGGSAPAAVSDGQADPSEVP